MRRLAPLSAIILCLSFARAGETFELKKGDHICLIGNALPERMQHDGWLETLLQARYPEHELTIRNLGFAADELVIRQRVQGFGSPEDWLTRCKADVIFAFFGFNESFKGEAGLEKFKTDLDAFIKKTLAGKFNGQSAPRLVLFSPIAFENTKSRHLPDGKEHNTRLKLYTDAIAAAAKANSVTFVDLFTPTAALYEKAKEPLTINGVHLKESGNKALAEIIDTALSGKAPASGNLEKLRAAILEKNFQWFSRYRPTDDYNIFGGRSSLKYDGVSNYDVLMREMAILEELTVIRDKRIWAVARGGDMQIDDSQTQPFIAVKTNKPGKKPDGSYDFLSGEDAISKMKLAEGLKVNLFASEEMFPELANPVQMAFDTKGRLWVAAWPNYPHWKPKTPKNDKLLILEDTDGDGKADKCKVFAGDLADPTGFEFWNNGVLAAIAPDLFFLKDTDGDDKADFRERVLHGISSGDSHHAANSFVIDPGGALHFGEGVFHQTQIESPYGPIRNNDACMWRFEPRTFKIERYVPYGFANPHGRVVDYWGQDFVHDGTGANPYHAALISGYLDSPKKHSGAPQVYQQRTRPCPGTEILSSRHFPESMQGNLLVANVIGFQGIMQYKFSPDGASFTAKEGDVIIQSSDPNFRPSDIEIGPDGAIYFCDWHKPLIGHMQHHIRDPNRDQKHGRVYRITSSQPLLKPAKIAGEPIEKLLDLLKEHEDRTRNRARLELSGRDSEQVVAAAAKWVAQLDKNDPKYEHHLMEALWLHQAHNIVNGELLRKMLRSPDHNARAAATRVLCYWRDQIGEPLYLLRVQAEDEHPLVRMEAVRACSFFNNAEAADIALLALKKPMDKYLSYVFGETMKQLTPVWSAAVAKGEQLAKGNPAGAAYILEKVSTADLLKMERNEAVYGALLIRHGVPEKARIEALEAVAKQNNTTFIAEVLNAMERAERSGGSHAAHIIDDLAAILATRPKADLAAAQIRITALASAAQTGTLRAALYAAWITAAGNDDAVYAQCSKSLEGLSDYLASIHFIHDDALRGSLYGRVRPLMFALPPEFAASQPAGGAPAGKGLNVAFYAFTPPNALLETFKGKKPDAAGSTQKITIDVPQLQRRDQFALVFTGTLTVPKAGKYTFAITSDDGSRLYINNKCLIDNDGNHGTERKENAIELSAGVHAFAVTYFDSGGGDALQVQWKGPGFPFQEIPPAALGGGSGGPTLQDEAIRAITRIPGNETEKFSDFAKLIGDEQRRAAAVLAIKALPKKAWAAEKAAGVIDRILAYLTSLPAGERTSAAAVDALNLGKELASVLPADQAEPLKARLQTLNVDVVVIRPVPHQMLFDHKRFVVEAGKPVEVIFENSDVMPHNLVIVAPGTMMEVGQLAEEMGAAGEAKGYIPQTPKILWHTKLVLPGKSERLSFTAPDVGEYPFVCTFPGHYLVMNGTMEVVKVKSESTKNVATVHADAPQRPFVKMWEMKDFDDLSDAKKPRSPANGKAMFTDAGCIKCHTINGQGAKIGPDLTEIGKKFQGNVLLKHIIEPSAEINDQFRNFLITTKDGKRLSGLITKEDETTVEFNTNPLAADGVVKIPKADITSRKALTLSSMPAGLLVTLNKDEILDLLKFVELGGKEK
ncbi:MAG TPA: PVC-type heme-binding CxxCH protein [Planctomycetota bacterium]|nr:PVC-type heme-binding CxxCH protein [Planctomycetota bacterium]